MKRKGQIWIETVLYTLIGLTLIGLALGFIIPKINEAKDKATVEQAINSLAELDGKVNEVIERGVGNIRQIEFYMKKGELYINASGNEIEMILTGLSKPYSEPGMPIYLGRIQVLSESGQKANKVYLRAPYNADIRYNGLDENKKFSPAPTPYKLFIENNGTTSEGVYQIDINEISNR